MEGGEGEACVAGETATAAGGAVHSCWREIQSLYVSHFFINNSHIHIIWKKGLKFKIWRIFRFYYFLFPDFLPKMETAARHAQNLSEKLVFELNWTGSTGKYIGLFSLFHLFWVTFGSFWTWGHADFFISWGVSGYLAYTDHHQGRGHSSRPTAILINIHEPLI